MTAQATKRFFATVQNKLHWAIHGQTAAEVIVERANATREHMGLYTWTDAPHGKIQKFDVVVVKNYLTEPELAQLSRLVNACLDVAEDMALRKIPMTMLPAGTPPRARRRPRPPSKPLRAALGALCKATHPVSPPSLLAASSAFLALK